jgi:CelD/BcsL family acetyltransferase involved in cellulose biosynthesis
VSHATSAWPAAVTAVANAPAPPRVESILTVERHNGPEAYRALRPEWLALMERMARPAIFQAPDFLRIWARSFAAGAAAAGLCTLLVRNGGQPVLIWPIIIERRGTAAIARGAGSPVGQYEDVVLAPGPEGEAAIAAAFSALAESGEADLLRLDRVRDDSPLLPFLAGQSAAIGETDVAPYADLPRDGFDAFMAGVKPRVQRHQRRRARQLAELGEVRFAVAEDSATAASWMAETMVLKRRWLEETGRLSGAFIDGRTTDCMTALAGALAAPGGTLRLLVVRLEVGGRTAAMSAGIIGGGAYHLYIGAFHPDFARFGAGNILTERTLAWCCEAGLTRYDMLAPQARSKTDWHTGEVAVHDFAIPLTARGRLYAGLVERRLKPGLRALFYALPQPVRSAVAARALKL